MNEQVSVSRASEVDAGRTADFLRRSFSAAKADFLIQHGDWLHRGGDTRWVLEVDDEIAGYCSLIPVTCSVEGRPQPAVWWVDLVIAPSFRGRGLQTHFDELVRSRHALLLGFPNALAARIHRHHGWGVRGDLKTVLLPLNPWKMRRIRRASGFRGAALRFAALALSPLAALYRLRVTSYRPRSARVVEVVDYELLSRVAEENLDPSVVTTWRDAAYLRWRYGESPYPCIVYVAGSSADSESPKAVLIARRIGSGASLMERWLDIFGDLEDSDVLDDLLRAAARESARAGAVQITALAAHRTLLAALRRVGFVLSSTSRFCWFDERPETISQIADSAHHWSLGDSDNDEPVSGES